MKRKRWIVIGIALAAVFLMGSAAATRHDSFVGTWHERDGGTSNIFYFIDPPVDGVYHVLYYDDYTSEPVCGDHGPMLWAGFAQATDPDTLEGSFGEYWCPDNNDGVQTELLDLAPFAFTLSYDPDSDTIVGVGDCVGTRQRHLHTVHQAIRELSKGKFPPSGGDVDVGCEG